MTLRITIEMTSVYSGTKDVLGAFRAYVSSKCCLAHVPGYVFPKNLGT